VSRGEKDGKMIPCSQFQKCTLATHTDLGFQLGSITTTMLAPVRFRPRPPALVDNSITRLTWRKHSKMRSVPTMVMNESCYSEAYIPSVELFADIRSKLDGGASIQSRVLCSNTDEHLFHNV
jgi:hypothetical protein